MTEYTKEELEEAIADLLDGGCTWWEIKEHTGLSEERCKELEAIGVACLRQFIP